MAENANGFSNIHKIHVLWQDCDPAGITFYGNYFRWMDEASYFLFKAAGIRWEDWGKKWGAIGIPIISVNADFRSPSKFGDEFDVESFVSEWGNSSFTVTHRFNIGDRLAAEGFEKRVFCLGDPAKPEKMSSAPIPDEVRKALGGEIDGPPNT
ncbi:MAG: 4-hydroxybenzoyl-CoA thioesterase [Rhodospirillaceae bacterium]|nr:4-hydroxybenzoyl-CoA thioesterase [Rhodospirillaceae bacterium]|tara:strand:- start:681 stop:1139 length:459 start_codon:yes stop_codon:yes gene_type:complete